MILYFMQLVPLLLWQIIWLSGFWILCWQIYRHGLLSDLKKNYIHLTLFLAIIAIPLLYARYLDNRRWGIVTEPSLAIYVGPGNTYPIKSQLTFLTDVWIQREVAHTDGQVIDKHGNVYIRDQQSVADNTENWLYIVTDQVTGWVPAHAIREYKI